jgi:hypothetical protein
MAGFKSELAADIISETVADLRRNQHLMQNLPVVRAGVGELAHTPVVAVPTFWRAFWWDARCRHPTSLYRLSADYVTGRRDKPQQMYCNSVRIYERERCGPQARFWEARGYPAWVWMVGTIGIGLIVTITYVAFLRWGLPPFVQRFV